MHTLRFLLGLVLIAGIAVLLVDNPGKISAEWLGWELRTNVPVLLFLMIMVTIIGWKSINFVYLLRDYVKNQERKRREKTVQQGFRALVDGLAAVTIGRAREADHFARKADKLLEDKSITGLLVAQSAKLSGDEEKASRHFELMLERDETRLTGLYGLLDHALAKDDHDQVIPLAGRILQDNPQDMDLMKKLLALQIVRKQWEASFKLIARSKKLGLISATESGQYRATIIAAQAREAWQQKQTRQAIRLARKALDLDPCLTAIVTELVVWLEETGCTGQAVKILAKAWGNAPSLALADVARNLLRNETANARLLQIEKICSSQPDHPQSRLTLAEAFLDAGIWGQARTLLMGVQAIQPNSYACHLLSRLEQEGYGDLEAARKWQQKALNQDLHPVHRLG